MLHQFITDSMSIVLTTVCSKLLFMGLRLNLRYLP